MSPWITSIHPMGSNQNLHESPRKDVVDPIGRKAFTVSPPSSQSSSWICTEDDMLAQLVYNWIVEMKSIHRHKTDVYPWKSTQLEDMPNVQWGHDSDNLEIRCISTTLLFFFPLYIELRAKCGRIKDRHTSDSLGGWCGEGMGDHRGVDITCTGALRQWCQE